MAVELIIIVRGKEQHPRVQLMMAQRLHLGRGQQRLYLEADVRVTLAIPVEQLDDLRHPQMHDGDAQTQLSELSIGNPTSIELGGLELSQQSSRFAVKGNPRSGQAYALT